MNIRMSKIIRVGNSKGVIIPSRIIKDLALEEGDEVNIIYNPELNEIVYKLPKSKQLRIDSL